LYDLVFVEPGPLPPHERSWRHPSELGPTRIDVDDASSNSHLLALVGGTLAVLAVAAMIVAMTPRTSSNPVALSATTTPITIRATVEPPAATTARPVQVLTPATALLASFVAFPHAVTSEPQLDLDGTDVAEELPDDDEMVFLRTEAVTYRLPWHDVDLVNAPDGSVVFDTTGDVVARVADGELVTLVGG
jgi:hypothetical protein